ncbi:MAG: tetratricopeptide repeat protein [Humidesulfovibrio sp.]|nr:tetratricopeptide repeat protein [Humidesulfovibrio sp.]
MPTRPVALATAAALVLAALFCCACAPLAVPVDQKGQTGQTAQTTQAGQSASAPELAPPAHSRRVALAAFHLRDEGGGGPQEALRVLDEPDEMNETGAATDDDRSGALALRAVALNQLGRYAEAVAALDRLMLARRDLPPAALADAFVERGLALAALGHQLRAAEDYAAALAVAPRHIPALLARADQHFALGQPAEAEAGYSKVIDIAPGNVLARVNRGVARDEQGRFGEAIDDFTQALRLDPGSPVALVNRGVSRSQAGDMAGMCADYQAACRLGACFRLQSARAMGYCQGEP